MYKAPELVKIDYEEWEEDTIVAVHAANTRLVMLAAVRELSERAANAGHDEASSLAKTAIDLFVAAGGTDTDP